MVSQTLFNRVKTERHGKKGALDTKFVSAEQREFSQLRAKLARVNSDRNLRCSRLATHVRRAAESGYPAGQEVSPEADAAEWHPDQGQDCT